VYFNFEKRRKSKMRMAGGYKPAFSF